MNKKKEPTFEASIARLEEIVHALDGGDAPLDKALSLFEEGVGLVKLCSTKLDEAEQRVKLLTGSENDETVSKAFASEEKQNDRAE